MTPETSAPPVGRRLAAARLQRGLTQKTLARDAGLAPSYLSRIENGHVRPTFETVMQIVRALDADPAEIVGPATKTTRARRHGPCPVTPGGQCLVDLIRPAAAPEHYTPREVRLIRRFAAWLKQAPPNRIRAMEILFTDLTQGAEENAP